MRSRHLDEGSVMTDGHESEERALHDVAGQLATEHPWAAPERITAILRTNYDATVDARVQTYRLLLAERHTRARLRHEAPAVRSSTVDL